MRVVPLVALAAVLSLTAAAPAARDAAGADQLYFRVKIQVHAEIRVDHGTQEGRRQGRYHRELLVEARGIAQSFAGRSIAPTGQWLIGGLGHVELETKRPEITREGWTYHREECADDISKSGEDGHFVKGAAFFAGGGGKGMVNLGGAAKAWHTCHAADHFQGELKKVPDPLSFGIKSPLLRPAKLREGRPIVIRCSAFESHGYIPDRYHGDHSYEASLHAVVTLKEFPAKDLAATRRWLNRTRGKRVSLGDVDKATEGKTSGCILPP